MAENKVKKKSLILKLLKLSLIIDVAILILILGAAAYFYYFVPVKTISLCLSNEMTSLPIDNACSADDDCVKEIVSSIRESSFNEESNNSVKKKLADMSKDIMGNFVDAVSKDVIKCIDKECMIKGVENFDELMNSGENKECSADEEKKETKITVAKVIPPAKLFKFAWSILTDSEIRAMIKEFIKTGQPPEGLTQ